MIHILTLKDDRAGFSDDNPDDITKYSLNTIRSFPQQLKFGCTVTNFADYVLLFNDTKRINHRVGNDDMEDYSVYLLMYQCNLNGDSVFKVSTMIVYNTTQENPDLF